MDRIEQKILQIIDENAPRLQALAEDIFDHAEQGFHEYRTAKLAADFLRELGLEPTEGLAITGVKASIGQGGPNVALVGELDGLSCPTHPHATEQGFAHACGHYAQMVSILGAALALCDPEVKAALGGTATIFAVPAEEFLDASVRAEVKQSHGVRYSGGKSELIRLGAFDDIDMAITDHSLMAGRDSGADLMLGNSACSGFVGKTVYIHGKAAHAAAAPHAGVNALNAASLGMAALGMIRETFQEKDYVRVHPYIRKGGEAINIVPSEVVVDMMVRASNLPAIEETSKKVDRAFRGAAMAIGANCEIVDAQGYMPVKETAPCELLWQAAQPLIDRGVNTVSIPLGQQNTASTDVGDLQAIMPVLNFTFGGTKGALHSQDFAVTDPYIANLMPAQMMALTAYHLLKDGAAEAKKMLAEQKPAMTKQEYLDYVEAMHKGE